MLLRVWGRYGRDASDRSDLFEATAPGGFVVTGSTRRQVGLAGGGHVTTARQVTGWGWDMVIELHRPRSSEGIRDVGRRQGPDHAVRRSSFIVRSGKWIS